jgi:hypothetical protein
MQEVDGNVKNLCMLTIPRIVEEGEESRWTAKLKRGGGGGKRSGAASYQCGAGPKRAMM